MGKLIKCKDRDEKIDSDLAYRTTRLTASGKEVKETWSSKEACELYRKNVAYKDKCYNLIKEYLGYTGEKRLPNSWHYGMEEFKEYGFDVVYQYLLENGDVFIKTANEWGNRPQTGLIRYCLAIIRNNIMTYYKVKQTLIKAAEIQERYAEQQTEDDFVLENRKQAVKNISHWLEGDD